MGAKEFSIPISESQHRWGTECPSDEEVLKFYLDWVANH
jgi:hypothetical protein